MSVGKRVVNERQRRLILEVVERPAVGELKKHVKEVGRRFVLVDNKNTERPKLYAVTRVVKNIKERVAVTEPRSHSIDSVMIFLGDRDDLSGLKARVQLEDEVYQIVSPSSVYVPAGLKHNYAFEGGSGKYIKIVLAPDGNYNAITT